ISGPAAPWWHGAVIYQIYPRSFQDSNDDGIGDLNGITQRLEHVASLGVDAIWLSPFFASPMKDFGYDVSDYRAVDPVFGTLADFDRLVARAHELGLKVVIDQVYAHTSDVHAWFQESRKSRKNRKSDWYVWADPKPDGTPPNNWLSVFYGPCWTWDGRRGQYYLHNFLPSQPNLNVHNPKVQQALFDTARFWLARGVDGFRLDAINFAMHDPSLKDNPPVRKRGWLRRRPFDYQHHLHNQSQPQLVPFIEALAKIVRGFGADRFTVAEVGGEKAAEEMRLFTAGRTRFSTSYGFDFLSADKLTPGLVLKTVAAWRERDGWPSWAFSNHDAPRVVSRWGSADAQDEWAKLFLALLMGLRGNVFLYQGEELGLTQAHVPFERLRDPEAIANWPANQGRDGARTPIPWSADASFGGFCQAEPWLPMPPEHIKRAVGVQDKDPSSVLACTRQLVRLRKTHPAIRSGRFVELSLPSPLLGFERVEGGDHIRCLFNLGKSVKRCRMVEQGSLLFESGEIDQAKGMMGGLSACWLKL
ncbi:MAG TPA: alpha-amylase family glycosyl hydrolase, partial [Rhizomicrobium sp.]|nr:alpha-amylase family glycosyl hydrolase [Rhizomicrobium sp.]